MRLILHDANQFKFKQDLLWVGVSTLATVVIWIMFSIYSAFTQTTIDPEVQKMLSPINPTLDKSVLAKLEDVYYPPDNYTILVKQEVGDSTRVVPLGTDIPIEFDEELINEDETPPDSSPSAVFP